MKDPRTLASAQRLPTGFPNSPASFRGAPPISGGVALVPICAYDGEVITCLGHLMDSKYFARTRFRSEANGANEAWVIERPESTLSVVFGTPNTLALAARKTAFAARTAQGKPGPEGIPKATATRELPGHHLGKGRGARRETRRCTLRQGRQIARREYAKVLLRGG
jgi:hypothetical protein